MKTTMGVFDIEGSQVWMPISDFLHVLVQVKQQLQANPDKELIIGAEGYGMKYVLRDDGNLPKVVFLTVPLENTFGVDHADLLRTIGEIAKIVELDTVSSIGLCMHSNNAHNQWIACYEPNDPAVIRQKIAELKNSEQNKE